MSARSIPDGVRVEVGAEVAFFVSDEDLGLYWYERGVIVEPVIAQGWVRVEGTSEWGSRGWALVSLLKPVDDELIGCVFEIGEGPDAA